jgi:hypothetical protein
MLRNSTYTNDCKVVIWWSGCSAGSIGAGEYAIVERVLIGWILNLHNGRLVEYQDMKIPNF